MAHTNQGAALENREAGYDDVQLRRAAEFEGMGFPRQAQRIRDCGAPRGILRFRRCKQRFCNRCAVQREAEDVANAIARLKRMRRPFAGVLQLQSRNKRDLEEAFDTFDGALSKLKLGRRKLGFTRILGFKEPALTRWNWNLHAHVALEGSREASRSLPGFWKEATHGRGKFLLDASVRVQDHVAYARYIAKSESWCPAPETMALRDLEVLMAAMKSRQLRFGWGFKAPRRVWIINPGPSRSLTP